MAHTLAGPQSHPPGRSNGAEHHGIGDEQHDRQFWSLALGSVGVVYGDIGTSPLYALKEFVHSAKEHGAAINDAVIGVLSLITWTIILIVTLKYVFLLLRADNKGEGGTFALMSLGQSVAHRSAPLLFIFGVFGAAFFYGDAVLTPAISVLSAVEGLKLVTPAAEKVVVPLTVMILIALFWAQQRGTAKISQYFGPIMVVWFVTLAVGGVSHIIDDTRVFAAVNPYHGVSFIVRHGLVGLTVMGLVFLAVTGAEALYADLGHFGRRPIQVAWLGLVMPALLLNYYGQGALVMAHPEALESPLFKLYPNWALIPMVLLATAATVIASQAVITGAFSITRQAIQLGFLPRMAILHTSETMSGQIYLPRVNWALLAGVLMVVIMFRSSSNLAAAYGVSVTATMVIDSVMLFFVAWKLWKWPLWKASAVIIPLLLIEQAFFGANMIKLLEGGWFPITIASLIVLAVLTWVKGAKLLAKETRKNEADLVWLIRKLEAKPPHRVPGTAMFLTGDPTAAPTALLHNLKHNRVLHERNIILTIKTAETPRVLNSERIEIDRVSDGFIRVVATFGFMETPAVPKVLALCRRKDLNIDLSATSFFLSRRSLRPTVRSQMPLWQERLFIVVAGIAQDATSYFQIPPDRVVEVGTQVQV